jgi:hypothetical protein
MTVHDITYTSPLFESTEQFSDLDEDALVNVTKRDASSVEWLVGLVVALHPQTPKHNRGGWSHYADTSEPDDGNWLALVMSD